MLNKSIAQFLLFGIVGSLSEEKVVMTPEAMMETYNEYTVHPWNTEARKRMAIYSFKAAVAYHKDKKYRDAVVCLKFALSFDSSHKRALEFLECLKKRHPEAFENIEKVNG